MKVDGEKMVEFYLCILYSFHPWMFFQTQTMRSQQFYGYNVLSPIIIHFAQIDLKSSFLTARESLGQDIFPIESVKIFHTILIQNFCVCLVCLCTEFWGNLEENRLIAQFFSISFFVICTVAKTLIKSNSNSQSFLVTLVDDNENNKKKNTRHRHESFDCRLWGFPKSLKISNCNCLIVYKNDFFRFFSIIFFSLSSKTKHM